MSSGKPSGAEYRRRRRERDEQARRPAAVLAGTDPADRADLAPYRELGPPPGDAVGAISYANRAGALLLHEVLTDPTIDARERRRVAADLITRIGHTYERAFVEERLVAVEELIANVRSHGAINTVSTAGRPRAPTSSRGGSRSRGLRPVPSDLDGNDNGCDR